MQQRTKKRPPGRLLLLLFAVSMVGANWLAPAEAGAEARGKVRFIKNADASFDNRIRNATKSDRVWMRSHYWRMVGFHPFFSDRAVRWAPASWVYEDAYAIYNDSKRIPHRPDRHTLAQHPNWALRDSQGRRLFIPFGCWGGGCPAYAADFGLDAWRRYWNGATRVAYDHGYRGIYIDDVNLIWRASNGAGDSVRPWDPRTGAPMLAGAWRRYMAGHMWSVRRAFPRAEIVHNALWFAPRNDPSVRRQIRAADFIHLERGFNDGGITGGDGKFSYRRFLGYINWVHRLGRSVVLRPKSIDRRGAIYELANYFLVRGRRDAIISDFRSNRDSWWPGWETNLGRAEGRWHRWSGVYRRNYTGGVVLVNPPDSPVRTVRLHRRYRTLSGQSLYAVRLEARSGQILMR